MCDFFYFMNAEMTRDETALGLMAEGTQEKSGRFRPLTMLSLIRLQQVGCGVYDLLLKGVALDSSRTWDFLLYAWVHAAPQEQVTAMTELGREAAVEAAERWAEEQCPALLPCAVLEVRRQVEQCVAMMAEVLPEPGGRGRKNAPGRRC